MIENVTEKVSNTTVVSKNILLLKSKTVQTVISTWWFSTMLDYYLSTLHCLCNVLIKDLVCLTHLLQIW